MDNKIKSRKEIQSIVAQLRQKNPKIRIATTNGAFDLMHSGHLHSLYTAKSYGDILIVGLNSDKSIRSYKSSDRPIIPQEERAKMLSALEKIDYVVIFDEDDPRELLRVIKPNFHVKSKAGFKGIERDVVESNGGKIILLEDISSFSTTDIIRKIKSLKE